MATTKIWAVKDSLSRVVDYASNPEKTKFNDLKQVLKYAENNDKTIDKDEQTLYVTGVNCNRETAFEEMKMTQEKFGKCTENIAYHAYQSFKTGEITPELAHEIGVKLAREMWGEHQVIIATHFNTGTYHNHFVVNSVNMFTGKKFNCNKGAYYRFREISDKLCAENNLTVIKNPKGRTPRNIYFAEKRGEPTKYNLIRQAIDETIKVCVNYAQFKKMMYKKDYIINDSEIRKYAIICSINDKKAVRMYHLGEEYLPKSIADKVNQNPYYVQEEYYKIMKPKRMYKRNRKYKFKGEVHKLMRMSSIDILFVLLFRLLGLNVPEEQRNNYEPLSPEMRREIRKMERYSNGVRLMSKEKLTTIDDVKEYITQTEEQIKDITNIRQKYRNKLRNCTDDDLINEYKTKRDSCTTILKKCRTDLKIANYILEDTEKIKEVMTVEKQMRREERENTKTKRKGERER